MTYPTDSSSMSRSYWARSTGGEFTLGDSEVDELIWLPVPDAIVRLDSRPGIEKSQPVR